MESTHQINQEQTTLWNGLAGRGWVEAQRALDRMFCPFENLLAEAVAEGPAGRVLDVGCGTGSTTLAFATRLGLKGRCVGVDISEPMLAAARARAERENIPARFIHADAQTYAFEPASFDMIVSRFGVMFFEDFIDAFSNLRLAAANNAELRFVAWRSPADNPFMTAAERAAEPFLPTLPLRQPDAPGQFAFADRDRVYRILEKSGWTAIDIRPIEVVCAVPEQDFVKYLTQVGPVGRILQAANADIGAKVLATVRSAFDPYVHSGEVRFTAACWMVGARA